MRRPTTSVAVGLSPCGRRQDVLEVKFSTDLVHFDCSCNLLWQRRSDKLMTTHAVVDLVMRGRVAELEYTIATPFFVVPPALTQPTRGSS
jgi:hypothetical protein